MAAAVLPSRRKGDVRAIFVHAGAGFHSVGNEHLHLKACEDACKAAMAILKEGGTAVDAVEMAIRILEDREITNAGYGSNLAVDGAVECDAIVVDHYGRSGAAGAVAQVKNPISLARLILDRSTKPLLLRRVPPNLLCGEGATQWAQEQGMELLPHDGLVSPAAQERWKRWVEDLETAERKRRKHRRSPLQKRPLLSSDRERALHRQKMLLPRENGHIVSSAFTTASPSGTSDSGSPSDVSTSSRTTPDIFTSPLQRDRLPGGTALRSMKSASRNPFVNSTQNVPTLYDVTDASGANEDSSEFAAVLDDHEVDMTDIDDQIPEEWTRHPPQSYALHDGSSGGSEDDASSLSTLQLPSLTPSPPDSPPVEGAMGGLDSVFDTSTKGRANAPVPTGGTTNSATHRSEQLVRSKAADSPLTSSSKPERSSDLPLRDEEDDLITDTVGAIAIDVRGNIAAGASSGGIGMKHQGRVGPAALVGVGASVIPVSEDDVEHTCVATVTSGTGEHMATTMASQTCSERMYHGLKRGNHMGLDIAEHDDDVVRSFVDKDFMNHPSVKHSISTGAIGVLTIKKTKDGAFMYFAHNTDSFALASMHANEPAPVVCMSRSSGDGSTAQGGRAMRFKRRR